jgi:S1-C subfamily serine protease
MLCLTHCSFGENSIQELPNKEALIKVIDNRILSTVLIFGGGKSSSGFIMVHGTKRFVLTNAHACVVNYTRFVKKEGNYNKIEDLTIKTIIKHNKKSLALITGSSKILKLDVYHDLCMLSLPDSFKKVKGLKIGTSFSRQITVLTYTRPGLTPTSLKGRIIQRDKTQDIYTEFHQNSWIISAPILPGMSGSPVIDKNNKVIGIIWGHMTYKSKKHKGVSLNGGALIGLRSIKNFISH